MTKPIALTQEILKNILRYDPETGVFFFLVRRGRLNPGDRAGSLNKESGYVEITLRPYNPHHQKAHRLAWLYMTGEWPEREIDHKNLIRHDNRWVNLRPATRIQQCANSPMRKTNSSGFKGVSFDSWTQRWVARIKVENKHLNLGRFDSKDAAHRAYRSAAKQYFGEFARA